MKSGLTVAAGIPGAIIGSMFIGVFAKDKGILGKNITQGMSSGGESIASWNDLCITCNYFNRK